MKTNVLAIKALIIGLVAILLSGCAAVVVTGVGTTVAVIHDRRTTGTVVEDQEIKWRVMALRREDRELAENSNINIDVFNMQVLLTGQAENAQIVETFAQRVATVERVRSVFNEVAIGAQSTLGESASDAVLTGRVKSAMIGLGIEDFDFTRVNVTSSQGSVFLMGLLTPTEADAVVEKARFVRGVKRVVKLFEYIDE
jgi:osmotically-inducible protein OsmY